MKRAAAIERIINPLLKDSFNLEPLQAQVFSPDQLLRYDCHQIFFIKEGSGQLQVDGENVPLHSSTILLLSKGQIYTFGNNKVTGYLIQFGDCFWQKAPASAADCKALLFDKPGGSRLLHTTPENFKRIEAIITAALNEFQSPDYPNKSDALAAYLKIIIIQMANIHSLLQQNTATADGRLYQRFLTLVREEGQHIHQVSVFAKKLGVSTRKLTDCCNQSGNSAKDVIDRQLIAEAKRLPQFSHYFKNHTHLSPSEYKQQFADIGI